MSYHPTEVGIIGYGLDDGRVGIIDTYSQKQTQFLGGHRGTVYEISWRVTQDNIALMYRYTLCFFMFELHLPILYSLYKVVEMEMFWSGTPKI